MRSKYQGASHRVALRTGNGIGEQGARALLTAVRNSGSPFLQHVRVQGNGVPEEMQEKIDFALKQYGEIWKPFIDNNRSTTL